MKTLESYLKRAGSKKDLQKTGGDFKEIYKLNPLTKDVYESFLKNLSAKLPLPLFETVIYVSMVERVSSLLGYQAPLFLQELIVATGLSVIGTGLLNQRKLSKNKINFLETFGADVKHHEEMPLEKRISEIDELTEKVNDEYTPQKYERKYLAQEVNRELTAFIAEKSRVHVHTSDNVRNFGIAKLIFPFGEGGYNPLDGEICRFGDRGVFEPHRIAHEFAHRKGYLMELEAQMLAYLSLINSYDKELIQSAYCERLFSDMLVTADFNDDKFKETIETSALRGELKQDFQKRTGKSGLYEKVVSFIMMPLYDLRMKLTGQNGIEDYSLGFTNFLYTIENTNKRKK
ncbi:MAG: DUF3810 family protein [Nanoarchaeota archaeon]|nr:DUF3810 family protein [Nanoarchaeota archaeon]